MAVRAVALLGPGLDGQLAIALLQRQGVDVVAATLSSAFSNALEPIQCAAERLKVPLHFLKADANYYERVRHPRHGYARELAPCLDCKIYMLRAAGELMSQVEADFVFTGDVVGQRLPGQSKRELAMIDIHAGLEGQVLRPLSAKLLAMTSAEASRKIDRTALFAMQGRGRQSQLKLAAELGLSEIPAVTSGCLLADTAYARKLGDLLSHDNDANEQDFALLRLGKHYRLASGTRAIVGRNAQENAALREQLTGLAEYVSPESFVGPSALVIGEIGDDERLSVARLLWQARKKSTLASETLRFTIASQNATRIWEVAAAGLERTGVEVPRPI